MNAAQKAEQRHAEALDLCERYIKLLHRAENERDEARAEVERLQAELVRVGRAEFDRGAKQGVDQALWASRTAQKTAYQRGAEAMREAAARVVEDADDGVPLQCLADAGIRALPLPEDKHD